mmetsp:Transcript_30477/g.72479  ORF Transcript_30477/g.72479 Transcript_30477/m.72479 type:complete len:367 (-) Transcript_30477:3605-4705(-)
MTEWIWSLERWCGCPSTAACEASPAIVKVASRRRSPTTWRLSSDSGKLPVVITVPETSGSERTLFAVGSSTARESVSRSAVLPSKTSGMLPPIAELISTLMVSSGWPKTTFAPVNLAPPVKRVLPTSVDSSRTWGMLPVVSTVPVTSGSTSVRSADGDSRPRDMRCDATLALAPPRKVSGKPPAMCELRSSEEGYSSSPMRMSAVIETAPRSSARDTTCMSPESAGIAAVVTIVPPGVAGNSTLASSVRSGTVRRDAASMLPPLANARGKRPESTECTAISVSVPGNPRTVEPPNCAPSATRIEVIVPASFVTSWRFPDVSSVPEVSGTMSSWTSVRRCPGYHCCAAHLSTMAAVELLKTLASSMK